MKNALALIIEDSDFLAQYFGHVLQDAGYDTEVAADGQLAQERLQEIVPDIILLDLNLPFVSGEQLLTQIRNDSRLHNTRVFIASANGTLADQIGDQADLVLQKPIEYQQLRKLASKFHPNYKAPTGPIGSS